MFFLSIMSFTVISRIFSPNLLKQINNKTLAESLLQNIHFCIDLANFQKNISLTSTTRLEVNIL